MTPKIQLCFIAILVLLLLSACSSGGSSTGGLDTSSPPSFTTFLQNVNQARYSDYSQQQITKVENEQAFEEMRTYILTHYRGVQVATTYVENGQVFDCVLRSGNTSNPPAASNAPGSSSNTTGQASTGNSSCQDGTIPVERITLEKIVQFPTLQAFLSKGPGKSSVPPTGNN